MRNPVAWLILAILIVPAFPPAMAIQAQTVPSLRVAAAPSGLRLTWQGVLPGDQTALRAQTIWPLVEVNGLQLPANLVAVELPDNTRISPRLDQLLSTAWNGQLEAVAAPIPQTIEGVQYLDLAQPLPVQRPTSPVSVLRDARLRGQRIVVLAISPIYEQNGAVRSATAFDITIPGATLATTTAADLLQRSEPFITQAAPPRNPAANRAALRVTVARGGLQRISGTDLAAAGLKLDTLNPARLHLRYAGQEIALEENGTQDGQIQPGDELRFYAPPPGDRWNAVDIYWLTVEDTAGLRMTQRDAQPQSAPVRNTALEQGTWQQNRRYNSNLPGPDGDHWFSADLRTEPGAAPASITIPLASALPPTSGTISFTIAGSAYTAGQHLLRVQHGSASQDIRWSGTGNWQYTVTLPVAGSTLTLTLLPGAGPDGTEIDRVTWAAPVTLQTGAAGAIVDGVAGDWRYELASVSSEQALYDISTPSKPVRLRFATGSPAQFEDGPNARRYLLSGTQTLNTPLIQPHTPVDLSRPLNADVLYIAPAALHAALAPLVARRQAQNHTVSVVDLQAIYDTWSFGRVDPEAIRAFLQYAAATWARPPAAVTLVGDGTSDPRNYTGLNNPNLLPPYLAMVDPWLGETACDTCFAQLDGNDPLDDVLPDLMIGRLPVKTADELTAVVRKIIGYETGDAGAGWRTKMAYIADNHRDAAGNNDLAGDFAAIADSMAALLPAGSRIERMYYDPWRKTPQGAPLNEWWREPDAERAHQRTIAVFNQGAGLINYVGHSSPWQWAVTDPQIAAPYLLGQYDIDSFTNGERLPIVLELTCLTSAFQYPGLSATALDERLVVYPRGGAVATWGTAGLGVVVGHDALQRGFQRALWNGPRMASPLGSLTTAGFMELFRTGSCCQDKLRTFVLTGDPLTPARVFVPTSRYLPLVPR